MEDEQRITHKIKEFVAWELSKKAFAMEMLEYLAMDSIRETEVEMSLPVLMRNHIDQASCPLPRYLPRLTAPPLAKPKSVREFLYLNDTEFWSYFHISRGLAFKVINRISDKVEEDTSTPQEDLYPKEVIEVNIETTVLLCLWYLRNHNDPLELGVDIFKLKSVPHLEAVLERGFRLIIDCLKDDSKFCWPRVDEFLDTVQHFAKYYDFPTPVTGIMVQRVLTTICQKRMLIQMICDENDLVRSAVVTFDTRHKVALIVETDFVKCLIDIPKSYRLIADDLYEAAPKKLKELFITSKDNLLKGRKVFLQTHATLTLKGRRVIRSVLHRFPRINKLHAPLREPVFAALILHNLCQRYDSPPTY